MTLEQFANFLAEIDPTATHYTGAGSQNYTVWAEYGQRPLVADGERTEIVNLVQVDRFTIVEDDLIAAAIYAAFDATEEIAFSYEVDIDHETRYIHHIFDCQVVL